MAIINGTAIVKPLATFRNKDADAGERIARIVQKGKDEAGNDRQSYGVEVAEITFQQVSAWLTTSSKLQDAVVDYVQGLQDACIRTRITAGRMEISADDVGLAAIEVHLDSTVSESGRISEDKIKAWFAADLQDMLTVAFADKLGISDSPTDAESKKLEQIVSSYRDSMAKLAGRKTVLSGTVRQNLEKALSLAPECSMKERLMDKLQGMAEAENNMMGL